MFNYSVAQDFHIAGKWKVVIVNNGIRYNYKTDSFVVSKKFSDSLIGRKDSLEAISLFKSFASQYSDYYFVFNKDGSYQEILNGEIRIEGTFEVDQTKKIINVLLKKAGKEKPAIYKYEFTEPNLKIFLSSYFLKDDLELTLERT
jgi:hypothetical protein